MLRASGDVGAELSEMKQALESQANVASGGYADLLEPAIRKRVILAVFLQVPTRPPIH